MCRTHASVIRRYAYTRAPFAQVSIIINTIPCLKNVLLWLAITLDTCTDFGIFGRNVTDKVSNQKTLFCATSDNLCFCTTCRNLETRKLHLSLKCSIRALPEFNQLLDFFNLFDSRVWLPKPCNQCVQLGAVRGMVRDKRSRERCKSWTVLQAQYTNGCSLLGFLFRKVMQNH